MGALHKYVGHVLLDLITKLHGGTYPHLLIGDLLVLGDDGPGGITVAHDTNERHTEIVNGNTKALAVAVEYCIVGGPGGGFVCHSASRLLHGVVLHGNGPDGAAAALKGAIRAAHPDHVPGLAPDVTACPHGVVPHVRAFSAGAIESSVGLKIWVSRI